MNVLESEFNTKQLQMMNFQPRFKHLKELEKFLLLISHSKSYYGSIFCTIRSALTVAITLGKDDTAPGHPSTSVNTKTTSTNIFGKKKLACYEWDPTKSILAQAKSATYKNLQTNKKQQQQVAANEDLQD